MVGRILLLVLALLSAADVLQAQPAGQARRLGILLYDGAPPGFIETFRDELRALGHVEGKNLSTEVRDAAGRTERLAGLADELVRLRVDVI
ncbi:MAG TPA: hypothetical protein VIX40_09960, partial [Methylomirabilota bacterium]